MSVREPVVVGPGAGHPAEQAQARERTPWLLAILCLVIGFLPANSVPAGPLKSNGAPSVLIAISFFGLSVLGFLLLRRTRPTRALRPGLVLILLYYALNLAVFGVGLSHLDGPLIEANKTRAIIWLTATVGVAIYAMTRVETTRQRTIVLGCLATGLTFSCFVAVLQNATKIDLHLLFQPPGFVVNTADQGRGSGLDTINERLGAIRAAGTSTHPIELSVLAAALVPMTIHFARFAANRQVRWLSWLACGVALASLPASISRSGVLALSAALLVYIWGLKVRQLATAVVVGVLFLLFEVAAFSNNTEALWQTIITARDDPSITDRTSDFATVSQTFHSYPVFGIGLGGSLPSVYGFLDNQWLQAIVQGGTVGLTAMFILAAGGIFGISATLRCATTARERDQAYATGAMFVCILVSSVTFDLFSFPQATFTFFILFGLLWSNFTVSVPERKFVQPADCGAG